MSVFSVDDRVQSTEGLRWLGKIRAVDTVYSTLTIEWDNGVSNSYYPQMYVTKSSEPFSGKVAIEFKVGNRIRETIGHLWHGVLHEIDENDLTAVIFWDNGSCHSNIAIEYYYHTIEKITVAIESQLMTKTLARNSSQLAKIRQHKSRGLYKHTIERVINKIMLNLIVKFYRFYLLQRPLRQELSLHPLPDVSIFSQIVN